MFRLVVNSYGSTLMVVFRIPIDDSRSLLLIQFVSCTLQVESVKKVSEFVSQLRRVGKGLGVYQFDKQLSETA